MPERGRCGRQTKHGTQHETDAWCPTDGKDHPDQQRSWITGARGAKHKTPLAVEKRQLQYPREVQPDEDEQDTTYQAQLELVRAQKTPQNTGRCSQCHKGEGKARHEHYRVQQGEEARRAAILLPRRLIGALTCQLRQEDGYQGQHAGRKKGHQPGEKGHAETQL